MSQPKSVLKVDQGLETVAVKPPPQLLNENTVPVPQFAVIVWEQLVQLSCPIWPPVQVPVMELTATKAPPDWPFVQPVALLQVIVPAEASAAF